MKHTFLIYLSIVLAILFAAGCNSAGNEAQKIKTQPQPVVTAVIPDAAADSSNSSNLVPLPLLMSDTEKALINAGLVDIHTIDSSVVIDLKYSTMNNFLGMDMYGDFNRCYLQPDVAEKLKLAQKNLKDKFSFYDLIIFDAVRPRSIQRKMWDTIDMPYYERSRYVSNPANGSLHNFGAAVDVSIIDEHGIELDMGTAYDYFGELAYPREEERMLQEGKLTQIQLLNRKILRDAMESAGFMGITTEWWHFNSCYRTEAYEKYTIIE